MLKKEFFHRVDISLWEDRENFILRLEDSEIIITEETAVQIAEKFNLEINFLPF